MIKPLTTTEQTFVFDHLTHDVRTLALQLANRTDLDGQRVVAQIQARQKAKTKLPGWYANPDLLFPPALSVEQASSEATAAYKASLVSGTYLIDLTGGMGVDTAAFAARVARLTYLEQQPHVAEATAFNLRQLGVANVETQVGDGLTYLRQLPQPADWLYLDPARRDRTGGRVVGLADCDPDVLTHLSLLLAKGRQIMVKTSPLLDIDATLRQLPACWAVHIVAVRGEVKELLFVLAGSPPNGTPPDPANVPGGEVVVSAVDLRAADTVTFAFRRSEEATAPVALSEPQTYLYEPNAAVLKAGAFRLVSARFGLAKLAPHSHLYTAEHLVSGFPGRVFQIEAICKADRKAVQTHVPDGQANLTVRNFPQTVEGLRRQLALREGGNRYLFATTLQNGDKRLLITRKLVP